MQGGLQPSTGDWQPRAAVRHKLFQPAEMTVAGQVARLHLLNFSTAGALGYAEEAPAPGAIVRLACPVLGMPLLGAARVVWRRGRRFGLVFSTPMSTDTVRRLLDGHQGPRPGPIT